MAHLILHIGSHKTGTTSIQYALTRQAEPLRRAGAAYLHVVKRAREVGNANSLVKTSGEGAEFATVVREDVVDSLLKAIHVDDRSGQFSILHRETRSLRHSVPQLRRLIPDQMDPSRLKR